MQRIGSREFKNRMGRYLRAVRKGQTLIITDRDRPVAKLTPLEEEELAEDPIESRLRELEAQGLIHLAKGRIGNFKAVPSRGKPASQMLLEDRR